jgi:hypothetical protein
MSLVALDHLEACHEALIRALDGNDIEAVETSIAEMRFAVEEVRAAGGWHDTPAVKSRAERIAALAEAARIRVNFLTDLTQHRIETLAAARGRIGAAAYGPNGRHTG